MTIRHSSGNTSSGRSHNIDNRRPATFEASQSPYLVAFDGTFRVADASTTPQTNGTPHKGKHRRERVVERRYWDDYMAAYEAALNATSRPWAPWHAIPADDKPYMRARVADIVIDTLRGIGLRYPEPSDTDRAEFAAARDELCADDL